MPKFAVAMMRFALAGAQGLAEESLQRFAPAENESRLEWEKDLTTLAYRVALEQARRATIRAFASAAFACWAEKFDSFNCID